MTEQEKKEFGEYARRIREEQGLSLREAEKEVGISNSYLYQIERGERNPPKPEVLRKMATTYNVSYASLLAAAHLEDPTEENKYFESNELERAFEFVRKDKRFKFGTHMSGSSLTPEAKRFVVEVYEKLNDLKIMGAKKTADEKKADKEE